MQVSISGREKTIIRDWVHFQLFFFLVNSCGFRHIQLYQSKTKMYSDMWEKWMTTLQISYSEDAPACGKHRQSWHLSEMLRASYTISATNKWLRDDIHSTKQKPLKTLRAAYNMETIKGIMCSLQHGNYQRHYVQPTTWQLTELYVHSTIWKL